jgi:molybdopterin converting factor small subunit
MKLCIRLFAAAKQAAGRDSLDVELPEGATIGQLRQRLAEELPQLSGLVRQAMFSINAEYAGDNQQIPPDAEVACIPPVSGG